MRKSWTDKRLDEFAAHTDHRFDAVDLRFDAIDRRLECVERGLRDLRIETKEEIKELRGELGAFQRLVLQLGGGTIATFAVGFAGLIATQL